MKLENIKGYFYSEGMKVLNGEDEENKGTYASGLLLPKDRISRNGVLYDWDSIKKIHRDLIGRPMMYNHETEGLDARPVGKFVDSWIKEQDDNEGPSGWYYKSKLNENSKYFEDLKNGYVDKVSIQVNAKKVVSEKNMNGDSYSRAFISDIIESSAVPVPGFIETSMDIQIAEAFKKKRIKEKYSDEYLQGFKIEKSEHPELNDDAIKQLVIDHLKKDITYYTQHDNNDEIDTETEKCKEDITTTTADGATTTQLSTDDKKQQQKKEESSMEDDKTKTGMTEQDTPEKKPVIEEPIEKVTEQAEETDELITEEADEEVIDVVQKEEYSNDMDKLTGVIEQMQDKMKVMQEQLDSMTVDTPEETEPMISDESIDVEDEKEKGEGEVKAPITENEDIDKEIKEKLNANKNITMKEAVSSIMSRKAGF